MLGVETAPRRRPQPHHRHQQQQQRRLTGLLRQLRGGGGRPDPPPRHCVAPRAVSTTTTQQQQQQQQQQRQHASAGFALTPAQEAEYNTRGFLVLRGAIEPSEHERLAEKIHGAFRSGIYDDYNDAHAKGIRYPNPVMRYDHGSLLLERDPEVARLSLDQPAVVSAVEQLLQGPAVISQWRTYVNPPGFSTEAVTGRPYIDGRGAHFDCKPWRPAGSFLDWMFAVVPLCDYEPDVGPMRAGPWDANGVTTPVKVLPSDGRVHKYAVNCMPPLGEIQMQDPSLKRGDVILMSGYCWHEACPNFSTLDRFGIYQKYHAKATPPAVGPWIHPSNARAALRHPHLMPYTRGDGRVAATTYGDGTSPYFPERAPYTKGRVDAKMPVVDDVRVVLEDRNGRILLVRRAAAAAATGRGAAEVGAEGGGEEEEEEEEEEDDEGCWQLPGCAAVETAGGDNLDCGNVIGCVTDHIEQGLGVKIPWMSWIHDYHQIGLTRPGENDEGAGTAACEHMTRVYGHRLEPEREAADLAGVERVAASSSSAANGGGVRWVTREQLAGRLEHDGEEASWVAMWQDEVDEDGLAVRRTYGYRGEAGRFFSHNSPGNPPPSPTLLLAEDELADGPAGMQVIGEHDEEGMPERGPPKVKESALARAMLLPPL